MVKFLCIDPPPKWNVASARYVELRLPTDMSYVSAT
jgi:hypothetical protein